MPTPRSIRHGRRPAATHRPLGARDGGVYAGGQRVRPELRGRRHLLLSGHRRQDHVRRDSGQVPGPGWARRQRSGLPQHRRGSGQGQPGRAATPRSARPTARSSSGLPTPAPGWCAERSTRRGTSSAARRASSASRSPTRPTTATSSSQNFSAGQVTFDSGTKSFTTEPPDLAGQLGDVTIPGDVTSAINAAYRAAGGAAGRWVPGRAISSRSAPTVPARTSPAGRSSTARHRCPRRHRRHPGEVRDRGRPDRAIWASRRGSEADGGVPGSRVSSFAAADNPVIFWTPDHGAVIVRGAMKAAWDKLGGAAGELGVPRPIRPPTATSSARSSAAARLLGRQDERIHHRSGQPRRIAGRPAGAHPGRCARRRCRHPPKDDNIRLPQLVAVVDRPVGVLLLASVVALMSTQRRRAARVFEDEAEVEVPHGYNVPDDRTRWPTPTGDAWQDPNPRSHRGGVSPVAPTRRRATGCSHITERMRPPTIRTPWTPHPTAYRAATVPTATRAARRGAARQIGRAG